MNIFHIHSIYLNKLVDKLYANFDYNVAINNMQHDYPCLIYNIYTIPKHLHADENTLYVQLQNSYLVLYKTGMHLHVKN